MATETESVLLEVEDIACELDINEVEVARLIARGRLQATRLGTAGEYRVLKANLEKFVEAGGPDLALPEYQRASGSNWFTESLHLADPFAQAIRDAFVPPSDESLKAAFMRADQALKDAGKLTAATVTTSLTFEIAPTGPVAEVMRRAVPSTIYGKNPVGILSDSRFAIWADLWAVDAIRSATMRAINSIRNPNGFLTLFDSASSYQALTAAGYAAAATQTIGYPKSVNGVGLMSGAGDITRIATFSFKASNILTASAQQRLIALAF